MELVLDRLTKQFGARIAVDRVSATLTPGVTGLLGANGAGKTTLMRMVCDVLRPTGGQILLDGRDTFELGDEYRALLGYLPQDFGYYPEFSGRDFLLYMSAVKGLPKREALRRTEELIEVTGLKDAAVKKVRAYSGGMKQRLGIAQALLNDPKVLIMDEPTAGLDPQERIRFRNLIAKIGQDRIVLLSTHIVTDLEHIADRLMIMRDGQLLWQGSRSEGGDDLEAFYLSRIGDPDLKARG
jgi:ABC-2 type transport system ATP-binding protein